MRTSSRSSSCRTEFNIVCGADPDGHERPCDPSATSSGSPSSTCFSKSPQVQFIDRVRTFPLCSRSVKTVEIPQVQFLGEVVVPVVVQRRCRGRDSAENCGIKKALAHRQGVDVSVIMQRQVPVPGDSGMPQIFIDKLIKMLRRFQRHFATFFALRPGWT